MWKHWLDLFMDSSVIFWEKRENGTYHFWNGSDLSWLCQYFRIFQGCTADKDLNVTAGLAIISLFLIVFSGIREKGLKGYLFSYAEPMPMMIPVNLLELITRPLSLCMRLFGNILGGFVLMELITFAAPAIVPLPFSCYFDFFDGLLQAYVFVLLTSLFINESIE